MKLIKFFKAWLIRRRAKKAMTAAGVHVTTDAVIRASALMQMSSTERAAFRYPMIRPRVSDISIRNAAMVDIARKVMIEHHDTLVALKNGKPLPPPSREVREDRA